MALISSNTDKNTFKLTKPSVLISLGYRIKKKLFITLCKRNLSLYVLMKKYFKTEESIVLKTLE